MFGSSSNYSKQQNSQGLYGKQETGGIGNSTYLRANQPTRQSAFGDFTGNVHAFKKHEEEKGEQPKLRKHESVYE